MNGSAISRKASGDDFSLSLCAPRLLRLRMKRNRIKRSKTRMNPPKTPPTIVPRRDFVEVEELVEPKSAFGSEELLELLDGALEEMVEVPAEAPVGI